MASKPMRSTRRTRDERRAQGANGEGDDDDGGDLTPENAEAPAPLTGANSQQLDAIEGGENGRPQLKADHPAAERSRRKSRTC